MLSVEIACVERAWYANATDVMKKIGVDVLDRSSITREEERLQASAEEHVSDAEVGQTVRDKAQKQSKNESLFERINQRRRQLKETIGSFPSSVDLLREDRSR